VYENVYFYLECEGNKNETTNANQQIEQLRTVVVKSEENKVDSEILNPIIDVREGAYDKICHLNDLHGKIFRDLHPNK
jgi:hypothetical protein